MLQKYLIAFFISMVPLIELRGGVPYAVLMGLDYWTALVICAIGMASDWLLTKAMTLTRLDKLLKKSDKLL